MLTKKIYITLLLFSSVFTLVAQKERNNWFFGDKAGLTWNTTRDFTATGLFGATDITLTGIPTEVKGSEMSTNEGCFSLSDVSGNLLFFSDGMTIWNKNKYVMQDGTGLTGDKSSVQSGIIIPYPNSSNRFITITLGAASVDNLSYTLVDMSRNGGLGAVETNNRNVRFTGQSGLLGETVTAVRNSNGKDFWIVALGKGTTSYFNVWKVTGAGVQTARHSVVSFPISIDTKQPTGYLKFTQDCKHFAWIGFTEKLFVYGDFDPATGIISNLKIRTGAANSYGYGLEFTSNGKYLYLTYGAGSLFSSSTWQSNLLIYDFESLLAASNPNSVSPLKTFTLTPAFSSTGDLFEAIQLGPDGRMYISDISTNSLFIIPEPDTPLTAKVYKLDGLLGEGIAKFGLPSFATPWFGMKIILKDAVSCSESRGNYSLIIQNGMGFTNLVTKVLVDFGDGGVNSQQTINNPVLGETPLTYRYKKPGTYTVTITAYNSTNGVELTETSTVQVNSCVIRVNKHIRGINK